MVNIPLLRKAVEWVETEAAKPEFERDWVQEHWAMVDSESPGWSCGSTTCIAGHVVALEGWEPVIPLHNVHRFVLVEFVTKDGEVRGLADLACELLGIPDFGEDEHLFDGANDAQKIRAIAEELAGERL